MTETSAERRQQRDARRQRSPSRRQDDGPASEQQADKQQFNVYLPQALIRRAKHAAVDQTMSLSRLVELALSAHLDGLEKERSR
ncbi:MAG TPA: hypothetical protein VK790_00510 [Solirubrobacteraceae bacterium]|jgi:hypothetical protein|nr:hypothetical protein [Solirubrobacteraceae bacterium]